MSDDIRTITQGDLHPPVQVVLSDQGDEVNFGSLQLNDYTIIAEQGDAILFTGHPTDKSVDVTGKIVTLLRPWGAGETDTVGRIYIRVVVMWPDERPQTFPKGKPLYLDVRPAASGS